MRRLLLIICLLSPSYSMAFSWSDLWFNRNQQGAHALNKQQPEQAATLFDDKLWQGVAQFQAEDYNQAAQNFAEHDTPLANYNRGNALAMQGNYEQAIDAYEKTLAAQPDNLDAQHNLDIVKKLQEQKQQQSQKASSASQQQSSQPEQQSNQDKQSSQQQQSSQGEQSSQSSQQDKNESAESQQKQQSQSEQQPDNNSSPQQTDQTKDSQHKGRGKTERSEKDEELSRWLKRIPDEPGGLLKQKFKRDYQQRNQ